MRCFFLVILTGGLFAAPVEASGLLIPQEKSLPPLALVEHRVSVAIEDQVSVTTVQQTFRNDTNRPLEATFVFPVPKGASVDRFVMTVDGKEVKGELLPAEKAREIYNAIVRRTLDPGLLEYVGQDLFRMRVFPVPPKGDQKVSIRFHSLSPKEGNLVQYTYPLKSDAKTRTTLNTFALTATVSSQHGLRNVYSPTHPIELRRLNDNQVTVSFEKTAGILDRDFLLFYSTSKDDVGLTALAHRPIASEKGYATLLISPRFSLGSEAPIAQDIVLVIDTSGSMRGEKMEQAKKALKFCLNKLGPKDRFGLIQFATGVSRFEEKLVPVEADQLTKARKWIDELQATGGTNIDGALASAFELRPKGDDRPYTIAFFTDGQPTIGETNPETIFKNAVARNTANTRVFTFGVGHDVNTVLLDLLAEKSRAVSTYVRPEETIDNKVAAMYSKMTSPVLTNLKWTTTGEGKLTEMYPPELPDLFAGGQLEIMTRFSGHGATRLKLTGQVGKETREFVYELSFPEKTDDAREFVEQLWARRKVGFLLDQIRINGEKPELKDEVVLLAKKYGITTPYTSWLIVPDEVTPLPGPRPLPRPGPWPRPLPPLVQAKTAPGATPPSVLETLRDSQADRPALRDQFAERELKNDKADGRKVLELKSSLEKAKGAFARRDKDGATTGKLGVDLAVLTERLRTASQLQHVALRTVLGRPLLEVGGVWVDEGFTAKTEAVVVQTMSDAYFRLLEKRPELKKLFVLGNHLVWITPSGKALVLDASHGQEKLSDEEIAGLFKK
ncbi:MAG: VIT domain-containing protein [Gemmataceae bacterium]